MFGMKAKETARKFKESEPKVDDVKVDAVDTGESFRAEKPEAPKAKKQTFAEAFKAARNRPTGSGSTFMWNGKSYHIGTKEEEGYRKGGRGPMTRNGGSFPESKKNTPGGRGPLTRASTGPDSKKSTPAAAPAAPAAPAAGRYATRGGGSAPSGAGGLGFESLQAKRDDFYAKLKARREAQGVKEPPKPDLSIGQIPALKARSDSFYEAQRKNIEAQQRKMEESGTKPRYGMAKGGKVGYSKMEKEHVAQMKKHGVPEKYVKEEEKEAKGMKCGGKVMKYAKGGGIESKGKTQGKMVRMASGGSVSARADGIASRGKTNCKIR